MSYRKYTLAHYDQVMKLKGEGKSYQEIGEIMGISDKIANWLTKRKDVLPVALSKTATAGQTRRKEILKKQALYFDHDPYYSF